MTSGRASRLGLLFLVSAAAPQRLRAQHHDPDSAQVVTADLPRFWRAYDRLAHAASTRDSLRALFEEYYLPASPGLVDFIESRLGSEYDLLDVLRRRPGYYRAMRPATLRIAAAVPQVRLVFAKWKAMYPGAVFPDVYFVIGRMNSGGTTSSDKILIGAEMFGRTPGSPDSELTPWLRSVLRGPDSIASIVAHELIHVNQTGPEPTTLLGAAIQEGSADFLGELISGGMINRSMHGYGDAHEAELWNAFAGEMHGTDLSHWLYQGNRAGPDRPADLGYYMGYRITKAYYDKASDKPRAIAEILSIRDFDAFLAASGYTDRFLPH